MNLIPLDALNDHVFRSHPQSAVTLRRWAAGGELDAWGCQKIGGKWFVDLDRVGKPAPNDPVVARAVELLQASPIRG